MSEPARLRAVPPAPRGIEREQGYAVGQTNWWQLWDQEPTPELQWPHSMTVFDRMERQDSQVQSVLRAVTFPVQQTSWRLNPAGARSEVVEDVAENLGMAIKGTDESDLSLRHRERGRFSWVEHLEWALTMLSFGHMVFEQVAPFDENTGRHRLKKLAPRWQRTISKWNVAPDGGLISIEQPPRPGETDPVVLEVDRLVVYSWERRGGAWTGRSLLRSCYKNWLLKDQILRTWVQGIDRNAMGLPVYTGADQEVDLAKGEAIARGARAGATSGAAVPHGAQLNLLGVDGNLIDPEKAVRYMDEQIGRSVLAHFLNLGTQTGSWALGSTFAEFFTGSLNKVAKHIETVANQHIVEDLVDWNWGPTEPAPRIEFVPIGQDDMAVLQAVKLLLDSGAIFGDPKLDAFVRDRAGLPTRAPFQSPATDNGDDE